MAVAALADWSEEPEQSALHSLLSPLSPEEFLRAHSAQRPLLIKGKPDKFDRLFRRRFDEEWTRSIFAEANAREKELTKDGPFPELARAVFSRDDAFLSPENPILPEATIRPEQYRVFYTAGASVPVARIRELDANIDRVLRIIEVQLRLPGVFSAVSYYSPPGTGVSPHFDPGCGLILQLSGSKTYRVAREPLVPSARGKGYVCTDGTVLYSVATGLSAHGRDDWELPVVDTMEMEEFTLEAGDLIFVPAGVVHSTKTSGSHSIGLTLIFPTCNFRVLIDRVLEKVFGDRPEWRHLPLAMEGSTEGTVPAQIVSFLSARFVELRDVLGQLQPDGLELNAALCERLWPASDAGPACPVETVIRESDVLQVVRDERLGYAIGEDHRGRLGMHIYSGDHDIEIEEEWVPFFRTLVTQDQFTAGAAVSWAESSRYDWDTVSQYLAQLTSRGLLRRLS
jgi:hypothetical protein